jgi:hypothetical protein
MDEKVNFRAEYFLEHIEQIILKESDLPSEERGTINHFVFSAYFQFLEKLKEESEAEKKS